MPSYKSECTQRAPNIWISPRRMYSYLSPDQEGLTPYHQLQIIQRI